MAIQFDQDAVSENIRQLISQGVGRIDETGVPSFNNADIALHQNIIRRERGLSPISITEPTGINVNTQALSFDGLNSPSLQGMRDLTMQIGELEGQKKENSSRLALMLQNEPNVVMSNEAVQALADELSLVPLDQTDIRREIEGDLFQATKLAKTAREDALARAGIDEKKQNNLIDSDIAKLQAQQSVLALEQERQEKILARRAFSDTMLRATVGAGVAKDLDQADKFLRAAPRETQEMVRRVAVGITSKNYIEAYDAGIDLGGRTLGEDMIVNGAPVEEQDNVRVALKQNADRMAIARRQARELVSGEAAVQDPTLRTDAKSRAARENQIFDGLMRDATFGGYEGVLLGTSSDELDASWFNNNQELLEVGKMIVDLIPPDADNMETAFATVGERLLSQGVDRTLVLRSMGKIIDARASSWNTTNRFLGLSVSREKLKTKTQAISATIFNLDRIRTSRLSAANTVAAGSAADIGPLGLFGLSELNQTQASGIGLNTPIPEIAAEPGSEPDRAPFQAPNRPGLVPSDASRAKLQQLATSIANRATRQAGPPAARQGIPATGPSARQTGALTPSAASRDKAANVDTDRRLVKNLRNLVSKKAMSVDEAIEVINDIVNLSGGNEQAAARLISDLVREEPSTDGTTTGIRG